MAKKPVKKQQPQSRKRKPTAKESLYETGNQYFRRVANRAYLRDGDNVHMEDALMLALLLHTQGKGRNRKDIEEVGKLLDDPNLASK